MRTMLRRLSLLAASTAFTLAGCGGGSTSSAPAATAGTSTVNFTVSDTPASSITVLSFQLQITSAVLEPGNVALLPRPVTVDLAQLVSDTGLLASTVVDSATYTSLELGFANPLVTIQNNAAVAITAGGQSCAAGATCTFVPSLNSAALTISSGVFPVTLSASSPTGLNLDLSIPDLLQSDLTVNFANGRSAELSLLSGDHGVTEIDDVLASINSVSGTQVTVKTAFGDTLVLTTNSSSHFSYPSLICAADDASCLAPGQVVGLRLGLQGSGALSVDALSYLGGAGSALVKGLVLSTATTAGSPSMQVLLRQNVNATGLSAGEIATVALPVNAPYSVAATPSPAVSSAMFATAQDLMPGQEVVLGVSSDLVTGTSPTFSASAVHLNASQLLGVVGSVDAADASFQVTGLTSFFAAVRPAIQQVAVQTDSDTTFTNFTTGSVSGLVAGNLVVAKGPLLHTTGVPTVSATVVRKRAVQD
jgi:hypothetical protein